MNSEYLKNLDFFNKNIHKSWNEWLEFYSSFKNPGKQGLTGVMKSKYDSSIKYVFKMSQYINYLMMKSRENL